MTAASKKLGERGERAAAQWYQANDYVVLARNWRVKEGEIDLICTRADTVVFVEVKTRSSSRFGAGVEAVDGRKQRRLRRLAVLWLRDTSATYAKLRFDVVDVDGRGHLQVYEDCF